MKKMSTDRLAERTFVEVYDADTVVVDEFLSETCGYEVTAQHLRALLRDGVRRQGRQRARRRCQVHDNLEHLREQRIELCVPRGVVPP